MPHPPIVSTPVLDTASAAVHDRIEGALLGLACGDALGAPAEFLSRDELGRRHGRLTEMVGGGSFGWAPGEWTDDTAMALGVARGLVESPDDPFEAIGRYFLEWAKDARDIGATTRAALAAFRVAGNWAQGARSTEAARSGRAAGNGSLMRTLPVALAFPDVPTLLRTSARISAMTHFDPMAETCCAIHGLWTRHVLRGLDLHAAWREALATARRLAAADRTDDAETAGWIAAEDPAWERLRGVETLAAERVQPTGYAGYALDCLEAAAWCVLRAASFEEAIVTAVNLGGETDTIAAVAGGPAGAFHGRRAIPARWLTALRDRETIGALARELHAVRHRRTYAPPLDGKPFIPRSVDERLLVGRNPLTALDLGALLARGVTAILDLREPREWNAEDRHGAEAVAMAERLGLVRHHVPVADTQAPTPAAFDAAVAFLAERLARPTGAVYVHCRAGEERTGAVIGAWLAQRRGTSFAAVVPTLAAAGMRPLPLQRAAAERWLGRS